MKYLLDTNICIYWLKGNLNIEKKIMGAGLANTEISFVTLSELYYGVYKSQRVQENLSGLKLLAGKLGCLQSNREVCRIFGHVKAELERKGNIIDDADLLIASCALVYNRVLVTNNEKHFKRITDLKIENWSK